MAKNKQSNLISSVKMLNISVINKYIINLGIGRGWGLLSTVKPRFSNASVLEQIGFRTINSRFLRFRLRTKIRISTKPKEAERTRMRHDAAYFGFFHTIFGVTELLYFFYCLISNFCKFFQNFSYCTAS